ncbi:MAG: aldolase [Gammaproteobacteria bacterium]|nr:aldolase [Gammaproteobacteria bacterium]MAY03637.1 aldolase [Gammaproteobacteria bacterium]|tara:strand:+ start:320112 stop:320936 length:825 start_codon:yes stop_codon:yes gene_type:complete
MQVIIRTGGFLNLWLALLVLTNTVSAQEPQRLNKIIEALEEGRPALADTEWQLIDMEHAPYSARSLESVLSGLQRDADGRISQTPLVRIPHNGDEDFAWAIKQVLDQGVFGILLPHVETREDAERFVQAMRYPPPRDSAQPEPRGIRGWGPDRAMRLWGIDDSREYYRRADVWPLNPQGELFAVAMVESQRGVENIEEILQAPVSAVFIVPGDLAIDLGLGPNPPEGYHPEVLEAYSTIIEACSQQERVICGLGDSRSRLQQRLEEGWRFIDAL